MGGCHFVPSANYYGRFNKQNMVKILHLVLIMNRAGQETFIMNMYRGIDRSRYNFGFLCTLDKEGDYDSEIRSLGGEIYFLPQNKMTGKLRHIDNYRIMKKEFAKYVGEYDVLHIHNYHAFDMYLAARAAKCAGFRKVVIHSHNTCTDTHYRLHTIFRPLLKTLSVKRLACSRAAGEWMYGKSRFEVINNGIDVKKFVYNPVAREEIRNELGISDKFVIGHIGRFEPQKNHQFLIKLFNEYHKKDNNSVLLLVGEGSLQEECKKLVEKLGIADSVIFYGVTSDTVKMYLAMDMFLFPSLYEGLGIVVIEAITSGLPCLITDTLPADLNINEKVVRCSLEANTGMWVDKISRIKQEVLENSRSSCDTEVKTAGYDFSNSIKLLQKAYGNSRKKAAFVFDGLRFGGIERVGINYVKMFKKMGYDITVFNISPKYNQMESELQDLCKVVTVKYERWMAPERYAATLKKVWWGKYIYPAAFTVMSVLSCIYRNCLKISNPYYRKKYDTAIAFSGHINDLTFVADKFVRGDKKIAWLHGAMYDYAVISPAFMRLYAKIKNLVSLSDMCDASMNKFMEEAKINKKTIYNPIYIEESRIDKACVEELKNKYGDFALMVARMDEDKDQKTAIDAIKILKTEYGLEKKLVLVGDGCNRKKYEEYVKANNLTEQIIFTGSKMDVWNYYSAASVYVHSSPLEGLPTVLLEAMYYKLPIAATDSIPGVREILRDGEGGLISNIFDARGLADNIYTLYTDKAKCDNLVSRGTERFKDFLPEKIYEQMQEYLKNI